MYFHIFMYRTFLHLNAAYGTVPRLVCRPNASMHSSLPAWAQYISSHPNIPVLGVLFLLNWINLETTPATHSLLICALSSAVLWAYGTSRAGLGSYSNGNPRQKQCWAAGAALALARLCQRASGDVQGLWWAKVYTINDSEAFTTVFC